MRNKRTEEFTLNQPTNQPQTISICVQLTNDIVDLFNGHFKSIFHRFTLKLIVILLILAGVPHGMGLGAPLQLQSTINPLPGGPSSQAAATGSATNSAMMGTLQDTQASGTGSQASQNQQSTSPHAYYGPDQAQLSTSGDQQLAGTAMGATPLSPHLQQNGYGVSVSTANVTGNGQLQSYTQQQQQPQPPHNGGQGTWTGPNTLTYTQSMQPPDSRTSHNAYCKCLWVDEHEALGVRHGHTRIHMRINGARPMHVLGHVASAWVHV